MHPSLLLIHSPLTGPSVWSALAAVARGGSWEVAAPDLTSVATASPPAWRTLVELANAAASTLEPPIVIVGHSGAGVFLPLIGRGLGDRLAALVFVDAVVPPEVGAHQTAAGLAAMLDGQTEDGLLKEWLDWWPEDVISEILPDPEDRRLLRSDMPRLARSFYAEEVPVPEHWSQWPCRYLQLSAAYDLDRDEAVRRRWRTARLEGTHLSVHTEPRAVFRAVLELIGE